MSPARPPSEARPAANAPRLARGRRLAAPDGAPDLSPAHLTALQARLLGWYAANARDLPWRHTTDPYAILVSEVMLQQTQVPRVVARYPGFLTRFPTLASLADAALADVLAAWLGLGYNNRALRLKRCAEALPIGRLPAELDALLALPGIGPYTARAVLVFAHNADLAAVDANVRRVLTSELGLVHDLSAAALQVVAEAALPRGRSRDWHNALMDYGSLVLTSRSTGIAPRTRQSAFAGSPRQRRARLLRALIERGPLTRDEAAATLGLSAGACDAVIASLVRDELAAADDVMVTVRHG